MIKHWKQYVAHLSTQQVFLLTLRPSKSHEWREKFKTICNLLNVQCFNVVQLLILF